MNSVELFFKDKTLTYLAGYEFGLDTFKTQVSGKLDLTVSFDIVFPDQILGVASSFVQGFFEEIVDQIGIIATTNNTHIISNNPPLEKMIMSKLQ